jgi:hypothetical protein
MDEKEWLRCTDPYRMLVFLQGKASQRKLRLFAVACCRRIWPRIRAERVRKAIEAVECVANGLANQEELRRSAATLSRGDHRAARTAVNDDPLHAARRTVEEVTRYCGLYAEWEGKATALGCSAEEGAQSRLLRELFGLLLFRPMTIESATLAWHDGLLVSMAQRMYEARDFLDLPVLADALEEAGCDNPLILNHCRQPGDHVGVQLLLGWEIGVPAW